MSDAPARAETIRVEIASGLARRKGRYGLATLCVSGGMGGALLLEHA